MHPYPDIKDLAILGDRHTSALIDTTGSIVWYPPGRFDADPFLAFLLDTSRGGYWGFDIPDITLQQRSYVGDTGILKAVYQSQGIAFEVCEYMPYRCNVHGLMRYFKPAPLPRTLVLRLPSFQNISVSQTSPCAVHFGGITLQSSHPITYKHCVHVTIPAGEAGFAFLGIEGNVPITENVEGIYDRTRAAWQDLATHIHYEGAYIEQVRTALRALRMLTYEPTGGVLAAATTSLPEILGGSRNYDYRYVWLRDAGMIASALIRAGSDGQDAKHFLEFICTAIERNKLDADQPMFTVDGSLVPPERHLDFKGYRGSSPVRIGNEARSQFQLDGYSNVLLVAKMLYQKIDDRPHWDIVQRIADLIVQKWYEPDHGIWEETPTHHYTANKVIAARGLETIAPFSHNETERNEWLSAAKTIREYVSNHCRTSTGAYAVYAGSEETDVTLSLLPAWGYEKGDSPAMKRTMKQLEKDLEDNGLYRRNLVEDDEKKEGVFLAGTIWVAQYWIERGEIEKGKQLLERVLACSTDLGFLPEEADPKTGMLLGNIPQTFSHAALIGALVDYTDHTQ